MSTTHKFDSPSVWGTLGEIGRFVKEQEDSLRNLSIIEAVSKAQGIVDEELAQIKQFVSDNFVERDIFQRFLNNLDARLIRDSNCVSNISANQIPQLTAKVRELEQTLSAIDASRISDKSPHKNNTILGQRRSSHDSAENCRHRFDSYSQHGPFFATR